jgi:hypothetical protein
MKVHILTFYECEHDGDLNNYLDDIVDCGGEILNKSIDYDSEMGIVQIKIDDLFWSKFKKTESYEFLD